MKDQSLEKKIFHGTLVIIIVGVVAKFASFISEAILAAYLGTTYQSDAYYMVSSIQQVIYPMLSVGIWKVFLPIYREKLVKNENSTADAIANKATTLFTIVSIATTLIIFIFSDVVVGLIAPGFTGRTKELCAELVRISSPMYIFIMAAAIYSAMLQCHNKFLGSQIREVVSHIPTILVAIFCYHAWGIQALAVALVMGGICRLLIELPFVDWGYKYRPDFGFCDSELKVMFKRLPSALISEGVHQFNTLIDKTMASSLPSGAVSALNYGNKLCNVFSGLLSSAIATALYPQMVGIIALDGKQELSKLMTKIISIFAVIMIPITVACVLFSESLVSVVFERGAFNSDSVFMTSSVFTCYCVGLFFAACNTVLINVFYGYGDTKTPLYISIADLIANVVGNIAFISILGVKGLALSTSISAIITLLVIMAYIKKYVRLEIKRILETFFKVIAASMIACGIPAIICSFIDINVCFELSIAAIMGIAIYFIMIKVLGIIEINEIILIFIKTKKH